MRNSLIVIGLVAALGAAGSTVSFAASEQQDNEHAEMQTLLVAKTTALQAGQAAEAKVGGKVSRITFGMEGNQPVYEVEVVAPNGTVQDVTVDAGTGEVIKTVADKLDEGDEQGENEDGGNG